MELKLSKKNEIEIKGNEVTVLISDDTVKSDNYDVILSSSYEGSGFFLNIPGEYEISGVSIVAQSSNDQGLIDITEFIVDDVSIVYIDDNFTYKKFLHDNLGQVNILLLKTNGKIDINKLLNNFDPEYLVLLGEKEKAEDFVKKANLSNIVYDNKLKLRSDMVGKEDFILQTVIFE